MIETDLAKIEGAAHGLAAWKWEPCSSDCALMDSWSGPCTCGAERRSTEARDSFRAVLTPETVLALVGRVRNAEARA